MNHPLSETEFREIYSKVPRLCVDILIRHNGRFLLTKRKISPYKGLWHLPGGTVYFGETVEGAALRVARDELGIGAHVVKLLGVIGFADEYKGKWHGWPISLGFEMEFSSGKIGESNQADEFAFFDKLPPEIVKAHRHFLVNTLGFEEKTAEK